jgi:hypothetical protein
MKFHQQGQRNSSWTQDGVSTPFKNASEHGTTKKILDIINQLID